MIDGAYAGPVASVDDCNLQADVVSERTGSDGVTLKQISPTLPAPCTIEVGLGMSTTFKTWLSRSLAGKESGHTMQLVRTDTGAYAYALELGQARLATVALPKIDRASTNPVFLKIVLAGESLRRAPALPVNAVPPRGFASALLVDIGGVRTDVATLGPWKAAARTDAFGNYMQAAVDVGNLPLRVTDRGAALIMGSLAGVVSRPGVERRRRRALGRGHPHRRQDGTPRAAIRPRRAGQGRPRRTRRRQPQLHALRRTRRRGLNTARAAAHDVVT